MFLHPFQSFVPKPKFIILLNNAIGIYCVSLLANEVIGLLSEMRAGLCNKPHLCRFFSFAGGHTNAEIKGPTSALRENILLFDVSGFDVIIFFPDVESNGKLSFF